MHPLVDLLVEAIRTDIGQMAAEEGHDEAALLAELEAAKATGTADALLALQEDLWTRPSPPDFPYGFFMATAFLARPAMFPAVMPARSRISA